MESDKELGSYISISSECNVDISEITSKAGLKQAISEVDIENDHGSYVYILGCGENNLDSNELLEKGIETSNKECAPMYLEWADSQLSKYYVGSTSRSPEKRLQEHLDLTENTEQTPYGQTQFGQIFPIISIKYIEGGMSKKEAEDREESLRDEINNYIPDSFAYSELNIDWRDPQQFGTSISDYIQTLAEYVEDEQILSTDEPTPLGRYTDEGAPPSYVLDENHGANKPFESDSEKRQ